jgi:phosphatidylethanolamine-binding protein (PEBP) family uncharacterized protein
MHHFSLKYLLCVNCYGALEIEILDLVDGSTKDTLIHAMNGHILEQATLMGKYSRT